MPTLARIIDMFHLAPTPRTHDDSLRAGVYDDATPLAVLMR